MLTIFYSRNFVAPLGDHIMPIKKFDLVAQQLKAYPQIAIKCPTPTGETDLLRVHTQTYIHAIQTGHPKDLAESQKFPWSPELYDSVRWTTGGVLSAARHALKHRVSAALASGFHHSCSDHGEGFCTFNGLVIALEALRAEIPSLSAAILDLDLHYGNGTAQLVSTRPWIYALSIYGSDYANNRAYPNVRIRRHADGLNHQSVALPNGCRKDYLLEVLESYLPQLLQNGKPDLLLYQAGADPLHTDPYSPLNLTHEDLQERDRRVFAFTKAHKIPVAWVLAGGYSKDICDVVRAHVNTALACCEIYE